jgi:hypothetical protein
MDNELDLDLDNIEAETQEKLKTKNRFEKLSETAILATKSKEEAEAKAKAEADARLAAEKERDFYKDFSVNVTKYPGASEYQDQILEKVKGGYSTEDAMISVLAKEGKLNIPPQEPQKFSGQVEGGSAGTMFEGDKSMSDMNLEDKRNALLEADKSGLIEQALRGR